MGVTVEIEVQEVPDGFGCAGRADLTGPNEPPEALRHLDVHQVWRMELLPVPKETRLDARAERGLEEKLQYRRRASTTITRIRAPRGRLSRPMSSA
jgi:hypothetical protein